MKYRKFNKYEKKEVRAQMVENALHGEGLYLYRNRTKATITLPRPTKSGLRQINPGCEFQGDNYYMRLVKEGILSYVKELQSPEQERTANEANMQEKLILDQPDMVTEQGKVEHVISTPNQKLNETGAAKQPEPEPQDVLLNEQPVEGGFMIVG